MNEKKHYPLHSLPDLTVLSKKIYVGIYAHNSSIHILPTGSRNLWYVGKKYTNGL